MKHLQKNKLLSELSTFGVGGPAKYYVEVQTVNEMQEALEKCYGEAIPFFILGKGSNSLFDDKGFNGMVVANRIAFSKEKSAGTFYVGAGFSFSRLGVQTARQGWQGLEFASGIPCSVGGAVFMNAGANGTETCDTLTQVEYVTHEGKLIRFQKDQLDFSYRYSKFHTLPGAIVAASFTLQRNESAREKQLRIIDYRTKTQPYGLKSAGCVFRNPEGLHAGALIEECQLKGVSIGGATVSEKHANFVINSGGAKTVDVINLISYIQEKVYEKTGIMLENEVRYIPYEGIRT